MKFFTKKSTIQKIVFVIIILLLVNFTLAPYRVYADDDDGWSIGGTLATEIVGLFNWLCDIIMGGLNNFMLGADGFGSAMLSQKDPNLENTNSWLYVDAEDVDMSDKRTIIFEEGDIDTSLTKWFDAKYSIPNMLYSPENIFANNIAALDINFLRANTYQSIYESGDKDFKENAEEKAESSVNILKTTIASWYKSFRNIAVVGLLSVLIYLGIRILISSTAADKAKYKESLTDWAVALCLVFVIHFIMSAVLMLTDKCTELFGASVDEGYTVVVEGETKESGNPMAFKTNLIGLVRFSAQSHWATKSATYSIMYWALVIYTCIFTVMYLKRFLYMAFFTMMAPLVALTYPMDRVGDGKAQAFNMWFKEYTMNAIIQPVHLILYTVFVGSAYELVAKNPIYALVALAFLIPAEKFIKKMFGLDKAESTSGFGSFAGGALAMSGLNKLSKLGSGGKDNKVKGGKGGEDPDKGFYMPPNNAGELSSFGKNEEDDKVNARQKMLDIDDERFATDDWDVQQRDALAREENRNEGGMEYSDEEYKQILRDSGYNENDINDMMGNNNQPLNSQERIFSTLDTGEQPETINTSAIDTGETLETTNPRTNAEGKPKPIKGYTGRVLSRGAQAAGRQLWRNKGKIARGALRGGTRLVGAAAGASVGLAAGITTGDFSKTMQFMGAGALAGNAIGSNAYNIGERAVGGTVNVAKDVKNAGLEEKYGLEYAREQQREKQNKKAKKEFMRNEDEIKKYRALADKMNYKGDVKTLMEAASDYKAEGITNDKLIHNALQAEYARDKAVGGKNHKQFVDVASFAHQNGFDAGTINDDKARAKFDNTLNNNTKLNDKEKREVALITADIFDSRATYEKNGKFGKSNINKK